VPKRPCHARAAITLAETVVCMALISLLLVAALNAVGAAGLTREKTSVRTRGQLLAQELLSEILANEYIEPDLLLDFDPANPGLTVTVLGPDLGESAASRATFDDVDDYHGWDRQPPVNADGSPVPNGSGYRRWVSVAWISAQTRQPAALVDTGLKRIVVTVEYNGLEMAQLTGYKSAGLPDKQPVVRVLMVVANPSSLSSQETLRKDLIESFGYPVATIGDNTLGLLYTTALLTADVAYVPATINSTALGSKLVAALAGVVNEHPDLTDEFGFSSTTTNFTSSSILITGVEHYITDAVPDGVVAILSSAAALHASTGTLASGGQLLGADPTTGGYPLMAIPGGALTYNGGLTLGRRVRLPWGGSAFDFALLNEDGKMTLRLALEWAASVDDDITGS